MEYKEGGNKINEIMYNNLLFEKVNILSLVF